MKRLFAMFLVISIIVSYMTLGTVYGAEDYSYKYGDMQLAKDVMAALDVVSYTEETANDTVSRIDFAIYLGRLLKIDEYVKTNKYYFDDFFVVVFVVSATAVTNDVISCKFEGTTILVDSLSPIACKASIPFPFPYFPL